MIILLEITFTVSTKLSHLGNAGANVLPQELMRFREAGMSDRIGKPFSREELLSRVDEWLTPEDAHKADERTAPLHDAQGFDRKTFDDLVSLMGQERAQAWLTRIREQLAASFLDHDTGTPDRASLQQAAHALVSQAGMLGFSDLAQLCSDLDQTCRQDGDIETLLGRVRTAAQQVYQIAAELPCVARRHAEARARQQGARVSATRGAS